MKKWLFGAALVLMGACADQQMTYREMEDMANRQQHEAIDRPPPDTCHMSEHRGLVGAVGAEIDQSTLPAGARVICFGCAVTLDYRAERLNLQLGADGKVASMRCG